MCINRAKGGNITRMTPSPHELVDPTAFLPACPTEQQLQDFGLALMDLEPVCGVVDLSTQHHHADGLYGRSVVIEQGTFLCGLPHKRGGFAICSGDITVWNAGGSRRFTGVHLIESVAGGMRVGYAHETTTWLTIHCNDTGSQDVRAIEAALVEHPELLLTRRRELLQ